MLICENGARDSAQIIPSWIEDIFSGGNNKAWELGDMAVDFHEKTWHTVPNGIATRVKAYGSRCRYSRSISIC